MALRYRLAGPPDPDAADAMDRVLPVLLWAREAAGEAQRLEGPTAPTGEPRLAFRLADHKTYASRRLR